MGKRGLSGKSYVTRDISCSYRFMREEAAILKRTTCLYTSWVFAAFVSLLIFAWSVINYPLYESIIIIVFYIWLILVPLYLIVYEWLIDCH
ncbi:Uncharacterised protein [Salmonella enterica subsp. enterica]|nr:Uncharacterised protein [Salmonella enterica subsp. enterica]